MGWDMKHILAARAVKMLATTGWDVDEERLWKADSIC